MNTLMQHLRDGNALISCYPRLMAIGVDITRMSYRWYGNDECVHLVYDARFMPIFH